MNSIVKNQKLIKVLSDKACNVNDCTKDYVKSLIEAGSLGAIRLIDIGRFLIENPSIIKSIQDYAIELIEDNSDFMICRPKGLIECPLSNIDNKKLVLTCPSECKDFDKCYCHLLNTDEEEYE